MSITKKKLAEVKRQVFAARVEAAPSGPTAREQRNMARLAARQMKAEAGKPGAVRLEVAPTHAPQRPTREYALKEGDLVTVNGTTAGYMLTNKTSSWIALPKGTTGVLVVQDPIDPTGRVAQRKGICHVSFPVGLVEVTTAALRNASDVEDSD